MIKLRILWKRLHCYASQPTRANTTDAGSDLYSCEDRVIAPGDQAMVSTGVALQIPDGWYGQIQSRSGLCAKHELSTRAGVIDSGYRGEIKVLIRNEGFEYYTIGRGDKIAQMVFHEVPDVVFTEVNELDDADRGERGFGSSDEDNLINYVWEDIPEED